MSKKEVFDLCIVPKHLHTECPYCGDKSHPVYVEAVEEKGMQTMGDIYRCFDCEMFYLVVEEPKLASLSNPVYTVWRVNQ